MNDRCSFFSIFDKNGGQRSIFVETYKKSTKTPVQFHNMTKTVMFITNWIIIFTIIIVGIKGDTHLIEIIKESNTTKTKIGNSYRLLCDVKDLGNDIEIVDCIYRTPFNELYSMYTNASYEDGMIRRYGNNNQCGLFIKEAIMQDTGVWECIIATKWECVFSTHGGTHYLSTSGTLNVIVTNSSNGVERDKRNTETPTSEIEHSKKVTDEKQLIDGVNVIETIFFKVSIGVRSESEKIELEEKGKITLANLTIIGIVKITAAVLALIVLLILLYKARNRINRLVSRIAPKTRFPPQNHPHQCHLINILTPNL